MKLNSCLVCGGILAPSFKLEDLFSVAGLNKRLVCSTCWSKFEYLPQRVTCQGCGRCIDESLRERICPDCTRWLVNEKMDFNNVALFAYNLWMKEYMHRYKFIGDYRLRLMFTQFIKNYIRTNYPNRNLVVVPVPVAPETSALRGFNQVQGLLEDVEYLEALHTINRKKSPQSAKNRFERMSTSQPFALIQGCEKQIYDKNVLIVDDVYTTGRTIRHAATAVLMANPRKIMGLTLAR